MEAEFEKAYWDEQDKNARQILTEIRHFIDYLEVVKREVVIASARLSSDEAVRYIGPSAEVAVAGLVHAIDYLLVCRSHIQETDLVATTRSRIRLG